MQSPAKTRVFACVVAENLWTLPYLSLGMVVSYLREYKAGQLAEIYQFERLKLACEPDYPWQELIDEICQSPNPVCLFSSYVWNHQFNLDVAATIKGRCENALILFGGPEVPKYEGETEQFLRNCTQVDIAVLGEGEVSAGEILAAIEYKDGRWCIDNCRGVEGIVARGESEIYRTPPRQRIRDLNLLPSPYLGREFEPWFRDFPGAILETNRGCPFGCTYCDWGSATLSKVARFDLERVKAELEYLAGTHAESIFIADANFGMLEQDIEIARALVKLRQETGYPQRLYTNFTKNGGNRLMDVIRILHHGGLLPVGIVALQTTDRSTLQAIRRDNVKTAAYETMMRFFNQEGIPIGSDLMIGLPGQTVDSFRRDLQFCFDWKVVANGNYTSMMPNAPMAERSYREQFDIQVNDQGMVASTASFTAQDLLTMKILFLTYQLFVVLGLVKYLLVYLQSIHGLKAMEVIQAWLSMANRSTDANTIHSRILSILIRADKREGDWALLSWGDEASFLFQHIELFYEQFMDLVEEEFNITIEPSERQALLAAQAAIMPRLEREYPIEIDLPHNVVDFFRQHREVASLIELEGKVKPLLQYPPGKLRVTPMIQRKKSLRFIKLEAHSPGWELPSNLQI